MGETNQSSRQADLGVENQTDTLVYKACLAAQLTRHKTAHKTFIFRVGLQSEVQSLVPQNLETIDFYISITGVLSVF